ncbi:MAG: endolytic transglycosylase MltG [Rothia sp. (in: high G+C Gram-positive bacteria)]|uniref:endolytic transglycosylase MltG n=1 Tax=Rothia sp. (in: high G+C Gram-positive bacteria) TaxID=1885016 RepID=UPI0026DF475C|nr:endolytic transglycosylase MltG [Rothia sp. (in: high G+C Gram-positive bacteria)]MDO5750888.1 endolytic transglycosylase MltG [Rothia sp. (in: high G+C Gram-positive bacteria)]
MTDKNKAETRMERRKRQQEEAEQKLRQSENPATDEADTSAPENADPVEGSEAKAAEAAEAEAEDTNAEADSTDKNAEEPVAEPAHSDYEGEEPLLVQRYEEHIDDAEEGEMIVAASAPVSGDLIVDDVPEDIVEALTEAELESTLVSAHDDDEHEEGGLSALFAPTEEEHEAGLDGILIEQETVSERTVVNRERKRKAVLGTAITLFMVAILIIGAVIVQSYDLFKKRDYAGNGNGTTVTIVIKQGQTTAEIAKELEAQGVIADSATFVETYTKERESNQYLVPGSYDMQKEMSSSSALQTLFNANKNVFYLAVPQGKRVSETIPLILEAAGDKISEADLKAALANPADYGIPSKFPSMEGWLHPGEYRIPLDKVNAKMVVQTMVDRTKADLKEAGVTTPDKMFEVLTIASIIEMEAQPKDYAQVSGIIENRINNPQGETNGLIQSDATVTYGLGVRSYHLTEAQKADKSNKYNTYANPGLPKGPIDSPDLKAVKAAAAPAKNAYYYWVTVDLDSGETKFSKTYAEHQRYVEEYNQWCSNHKNRCS